MPAGPRLKGPFIAAKPSRRSGWGHVNFAGLFAPEPKRAR